MALEGFFTPGCQGSSTYDTHRQRLFKHTQMNSTLPFGSPDPPLQSGGN